MVRVISQRFELIPSIQSRGDVLAPISLVPALPVRFENSRVPPQYGVVDTSAKISTIVSSLANELEIHKQSIGSKITLATAGKLITVDVFKISIIICDQHFGPWIYLRKVPFAVLPDSEASSSQGKIALGFDSCLSNLHLDLNYPQKILKVTVPAHLLASESERTKPEMPSRILEGEKLIALGSYNAAVTMIAAGLEEVIASSLQIPLENQPTIRELQSRLPRDVLSAKFKHNLEEIREFRNKAVHSATGEQISVEDARRILRYAKSILNELTNIEKEQIGKIV